MNLAYGVGLLWRLPGRREARFANSELQAAFALEKWFTSHDWSEHLVKVKSNPAWHSLIILAAVRWEHQEIDTLLRENFSPTPQDIERLPFRQLDELFKRLCDSEGADQLELHWLLAARCFANLNQATREALGKKQVGVNIRKKILEWFKSPNIPLHYFAAELLPAMRTRALVGALAYSLRQGEIAEGETALVVLGKLGGREAALALAEIVDDEKTNTSTCIAALQALGVTGEGLAFEEIKSSVSNELLRDAALKALALHNSVSAEKELLVLRSNLFAQLDEASSDSQKAAKLQEEILYLETVIDALENPTPMLLPVFREAINQRGSKVLLRMVARIGNEEALALLTNYLHSQDRATFAWAAEALGEMKSRAANEILISFAWNEEHSYYRRSHAVVSLPHILGFWDPKVLLNLLLSLRGDVKPRKMVLTDLQTQGPPDEMPEEDYTSNDLISAVSNVLHSVLNRSIAALLQARYGETRDLHIRRKLFYILSDMSHVLPRTFFEDAANEEDENIRQEASYILDILEPRDPLLELENSLKTGEKLGGSCHRLRFADERAVPLLHRVIMERITDLQAVQEAIFALGTIKSTEATNILLGLWKQPFTVDYRELQVSLIKSLIWSDPVRTLRLLHKLPVFTEPAPVFIPDAIYHAYDEMIWLHLVEQERTTVLSEDQKELLDTLKHEGRFGPLNIFPPEKTSHITSDSVLSLLLSVINKRKHLEEADLILNIVIETIDIVFSSITNESDIHSLEELMDSPNEKIRLFAVRTLGKVPRVEIKDDVVDKILSIALEGDPYHILTLTAFRSLLHARHPVTAQVWVARQEQWRRMPPKYYQMYFERFVDPMYLAEFADLKLDPLAHEFLCLICLVYDLRLMPEGKVFLHDGRQIPLDKVILEFDVKPAL